MKKYYFFFLIALVSGFASAQIVNIPDANFKLTLLNYTPVIDTNGDGEIQVSEAEAVDTLTIGSMISNITGINAFSNLTTLNVHTWGIDGIQYLDVSGLHNLVTLDCSNSNSLGSITVTGLASLQHLDCSYTSVTAIYATGADNIATFNCSNTAIPSFFVNLALSHMPHLKELECRSMSNLTSLDVSGLTELEKLFCENSNLTVLDVTALTKLRVLFCPHNHISTLNLFNLTHLGDVTVSYNNLNYLDFSHFEYVTGDMPFISYNVSNNPNLTYLNVKVGMGTLPDTFLPPVYMSNCPQLAYICANENNVSTITANLLTQGMTNTQVNSYCTFTPAGSFNTISGTLTYDSGNNGCDAGDFVSPNVRMRINDGTLSGSTFSNASGNYSFYTGIGNFTITPEFENPYFAVSPAAASAAFTLNNSAVESRSFCITPLGTHNDLEITLHPTTAARPGFNASYILIYKNKGNQLQSGNISLAFDDTALDLVSANPMTASQAANTLSWDFTDLHPFESRTITVILNVNGPTETPAVNIGDILYFTAFVSGAVDETPADNTSNFNQVVIGSIDPNDKTCTEGSMIDSQKVGDYLHYVIRFQNSGTAAAESVVVKDIIDTTKFDMDSLELTATSHPQTTKITDNKIEFIFESIQLPAAIDDEPASHGFVAFKIRTRNDLVAGNTVANKADIYFDYNFPIITNTASTTVALLANAVFEDQTVAVFPNPAKDQLTITAKDKISSVQLYDIQGRLIESAVSNDNNIIFDLAKNASGVYFVKIYTANGVKVEKIIKE